MGSRWLYLFKNGSLLQYAANQGATPGGGTYNTVQSASTLLRLNAGDYLEVQVYQNSGGSLNVIGSSPDNSFTMAWVSP